MKDLESWQSCHHSQEEAPQDYDNSEDCDDADEDDWEHLQHFL